MTSLASRCTVSVPALAGLTLALALAFASHGRASAAGESASGRVQISGTVYAFDNQAPIAGAVIKVEEKPALSAVSAADGSYELGVPDGAKITPFVAAPGYHGIYVQTFVTTGKDLERVNFQVPSDGIYAGLAAILGVELDQNGNPAQCAVVSTFNTVNVRDLSFQDFVAYGAHGVAGATASATPPVSDPTYFNASVIPDASLTESSVDGGVIWLDVPKGVYTFRAQHPTERFASFRATCKPGRLVNANPPWGLFQLKPGEKVDRKVTTGLASARFRTGEHGQGLRLSVKVKAREYVSLGARLMRGGRELAREREERYDDGVRRFSMPVPAGLAGRTMKLRLRFKDAFGNQRSTSTRLRAKIDVRG